jgi:vacuolar protein sorting-associated protein 13B
MFKLESYVTPLLMGYIDQYVALKQEDFQLSLWGGDAVLNKLDLRLDVIEKAIQLPVTFKSGHIHELRLHVPWTALGSEPVIITINTIECVLMLRDSAHENASQTSEVSQKSDKSTKTKKKQKQLEEPDLPPGYIQGLINRILNNLNIVVNNLILKFVEDDIVLSVNVKSAEIYSANSNWMRDFVDLAVPDLALRRVIDFSDLTICLDRRNASGKIETYQDPLLYRCPITCRMHSQYEGLYSKYPSTTKINFLCEKLDLSLTDTQVPMFFRLLELCIAIYYGTLRLPEPKGSEASETSVPLNPHLESSVDPPSIGIKSLH